MRKLVQGIVDFRKGRRPDYAETFARLALRQKPDALYIACSDSRVQANVFASTEPGDLFVVRNPGNLVSPAGPDGKSISDESEAAAIEFALDVLEVRDIIVCGHSGCGAMAALALREGGAVSGRSGVLGLRRDDDPLLPSRGHRRRLTRLIPLSLLHPLQDVLGGSAARRCERSDHRTDEPEDGAAGCRTSGL